MGKINPLQVSVIIPTYNRAHTIGRAIESILNQTYQNFEIIIVDDGSSDNTKNVVEEYKKRDGRIRYIRLETNCGAAAARNEGIRTANGKYVAFLDSDDEWLPEKLTEQVGVLKSPSTAMLASCSGYYLHLFSSKIVTKKVLQRPKSWLNHFLLVGCGVAPGSTLVTHKKVFDKIGLFDEKLLRYEDWDWLIRYSKIYDLVYIEKPLANIYIGNDLKGEMMEGPTFVFISKYYQDLSSYGMYQRNKAIAKHWINVAIVYFREGKNKKGFLIFLKALYLDPFQGPSPYLGVIDAIFGTTLGIRLPWWKRRLFGQEEP